MEISNIELGTGVKVDPSSSINNVRIGNNVKIAKNCSIFGSKDHLLEIGEGTIVTIGCFLNGYARPLRIGKYVSVGQNTFMMTDSGPTASELMLQAYPLTTGEVIIEDHVWIGVGCIIMPGVTIGRCSIIAANSFVAGNVEPYSLYGGNPARMIKKLEELRDLDKKQAEIATSTN